jgi:hypothetical protein
VCCGREKKTFNLRMSLMGCKNIERKNDQKYRKEKIMTGQKKKKKILRLSVSLR